MRFKGRDFNAELKLDIRDVYETHKRTLTINGKNISLTIPAGARNGQTIKIKGQGVNDVPNGDLFITYNIKTPQNLSEKEKQLFKELSN